MVSIAFVRIVFTIVLVAVYPSIQIKPEALEEYMQICNNVTSKPFFDHSMVVRRKWVVYYNWNMKIGNACQEVYFRYPNDMIIKRIYQAMNGFVKSEPLWYEAVLLMIIGASREMLLFRDPVNIRGRFLGVPNMSEEDVHDMFKSTMKVPLWSMAMKLIQKGKYLIMSDCQLGVTSLAVRKDYKPWRAEVDTVAATYNFGDGFPACINGPQNVDE